ncbi:transcriptional regulator [Sinomicrobium soli]|uniref:transcriptional regulator n=1 Tax=Sinomicrobium sp. N-1-3-6 TaxID=2219864 RepID=UPI000DCDE332|nr:transcriptional regulator [Sinomicrobium sp. N-1-3-6]RAV28474.1 transcriptional regulator [Sinomicrobium sp. N-1-3-6]
MDDKTDIGKLVSRYIYYTWISKAKSQRDFASTHDIEEATVRRIKNVALGTSNVEYNMTVKTLHKICNKRGISLQEFFKSIEEFSKGRR